MIDAIGTCLEMVVSIVGWSISIVLFAVERSLAAFNLSGLYAGKSTKLVTCLMQPQQCRMIPGKRAGHCYSTH